MEEFNDFELVRKSEADADHFKFSTSRKLEAINKCKLPYYMPIVVYTVNPDIPDLIKTIYIIHRFSTVDDVLETVKSYLDYEHFEHQDKIEHIKSLQFGFRAEVRWANEEDLLIYGDFPIEELWEDYKNPGDKILYMMLDAK